MTDSTSNPSFTNTPDRFIAAAFREWADRKKGAGLPEDDIIYSIEQKAAELARESVGDGGKSVAWVSEVFPDWTTLQVIATGEAYAFNRETGRVYKLPDPDCPFLQWPNITAWNTRAAGDKE